MKDKLKIMREAKPDMLAQTCNPSMLKGEAGDQNSKASLGCTARSFPQGREGATNQITDLLEEILHETGRFSSETMATRQ